MFRWCLCRQMLHLIVIILLVLREPLNCSSDVKKCADGTFVNRNPNDGCEFFDCPDDDSNCSADVKLCSDGSYVGRSAELGCSFPPCEGDDAECNSDVALCPDGTYIGSHDPSTGCIDFLPCASDTGKCDKGLLECVDGVYAVKDPKADCDFIPCVELIIQIQMKIVSNRW